MMHQRFVCSLFCLACTCLVVDPVQAWHDSEYKAVIKAPKEVRLQETKIVPVTVEITTPTGQPYSSEAAGPVGLWTSYGQFVKQDRTRAQSPFTVNVSGGTVKATISLDCDSLPGPLRLSVTRGSGDYEVLGEASVDVRYQEYITVTAVNASALADGIAKPVIIANVQDQHKKPLDNVRISACVRGRAEGRTTVYGTTDSSGNARIELPSSRSASYADVQIRSDRLSSAQIPLVYADQPAAMVGLQEVGMRLRAGLHWDRAKREVMLRGRDIDLHFRVGEDVAMLNGDIIPFGTQVQLKDGRVQVPLLFVDRFLGY